MYKYHIKKSNSQQDKLIYKYQMTIFTMAKNLKINKIWNELLQIIMAIRKEN